MFLEDYTLYYINLDERKDRNLSFTNQMSSLGVEKYKRISACTEADLDEETLKQGVSLGCRSVEVATSMSHLKAIKDFVENSNDEYAFICEDDAELSNIKKIHFTITDLFKNFSDAECFQLSVSTRRDIVLDFKIHERAPWDFNCTAYLISKKYAKKLVDTYFKNNVFVLDNFTPTDIFDYRSKTNIQSQPVAEYIVYGLTKTLSCSIFSFTLSESSIQVDDQNTRQNVKSNKKYLEHWNNYNKIFISSLLGEKSLAWITLTNGRKDLISESRETWYSNAKGFIDVEIIIDDSGDETYRQWLSTQYPSARIVPVGDTPQGYKNAMKKCFETAISTECDYILHTEDDFTLNEEVDLSKITSALSNNSSLSQISLQRQPWYDHEKIKDTYIRSVAAQGYSFVEKNYEDISYLEHSFYWTCNPNIYPIEIAKLGWPSGPRSEITFTKRVFSSGYVAAFYGKEDSKNHVTHTGFYKLGYGH